MRARLSVSFALVACVALGLQACPGRIENPDDFVGAAVDGSAPTCTIGVSNVELQLIRPRCATSNCHDRAGRAGGLDLESPGLSSRILGARSSMCAGQVLADPNAPASGYFVAKLNAAPACGSRMPLGTPPLTAGELTCVRGWLATLRPDAGTPVDVPRDTAADIVLDRPDVSDVADASDAPAMDAADAPAMDAPDASDASDARDASDASDVRDASDASDASDVRDASDDADVDDAGDA